jgi:DNA-binding response OmpR family regulator
MMAKRSPLEPQKSPSVLVVDDDRRVRELLEIALTAHGFGVLTAADGDEAIRRALGQRPDLVVLDVRLPKKSGLEVCDALRGDTEDPSVPIILVSAAVETDARLQAFARGADDYLAKPFSPKELIARIKRHLARHAEARGLQRRAQELERDLSRARDEARRAEDVSRREQALRELASGAGRDFLRILDLDELSDRILAALQRRLNVGVAALLTVDGGNSMLEGCAIRGGDEACLAGLSLRSDGEVAGMLAGLERPMLRADLERIPELKPELESFMAAGFSLFVPLRGSSGGLEALIVAGERHDGLNPSRADLDVLSGLSESAAIAIENSMRSRAQIDGLLDVLAERAHGASGRSAACEEAGRLVARAARAGGFPPHRADLIRRAVLLGDFGATPEGVATFARIAAIDPTGRVSELENMLQARRDDSRPLPERMAGRWRALALLSFGWRYAEARAQGVSPGAALAQAIESAGARLDSDSRNTVNATLAGLLERTPLD